MSQSNLRSSYATDEDIALAAGADFALLYPADQLIAAGAAGSFAPADRWTLSSPSTDFAARGARAGQVALLRTPSASFGAAGTFFAVQSAGTAGLTLRRKGLAAGAGEPAAPAAGLAGVGFLLATLAPQIERASADLDRRFGIDPAVPGRSAANLRDPSALRDATVLLVLSRLYLDLSRTGSGGEPAAEKGQALRRELDDLLARTALGWTNGQGPVSRFSTRIVR
jgi:hypothetical protein